MRVLTDVSSSESQTGYRVHTASVLYSLFCPPLLRQLEGKLFLSGHRFPQVVGVGYF